MKIYYFSICNKNQFQYPKTNTGSYRLLLYIKVHHPALQFPARHVYKWKCGKCRFLPTVLPTFLLRENLDVFGWSFQENYCFPDGMMGEQTHLLHAFPVIFLSSFSKPLDRLSLQMLLSQHYSDRTAASGHSRRTSLSFQRKANPPSLGSPSAAYMEAMTPSP